MTQRDVVLGRLRAAGAKGVSARTFVYEDGITRSAAIVFQLRGEGYEIETIDEGYADTGKKRMARYVLHDNKAAPVRERSCVCEGFAWACESGCECWHHAANRALQPIRWECGCVRAADGRSWEARCGRHALGTV